jgi:thioredoxin-like negative regulator of GroEL
VQEWRAKGHGSYSEVADQTEWFHEVKTNERVVCHFYRPSTWRCEIIDKHLSILAQKHLETKFIKINAEKSPFLCQRLEVVLLPTLICTKDNFTSDTIEGFDELGARDDFTTEDLAARLAIKGSIFYEPEKKVAQKGKSTNTVKSNKAGNAIYKSKQTAVLDSDDDESDQD